MHRKRFLIYFTQFPIFSTFLSVLGFLKPEKHYFLNQFSIAGFQFHEGVHFIAQMKKGDNLKIINEPENKYDDYAVRIEYKSKMIDYVPRSDNRHLFRMLKQDLSLHCEITEVNPNEESWQMCKVKVELIG